ADEENVKVIQKQHKNKKIILGLGRLVSYKGFSYLVESAKYLGDDFMILIGGTGPEEAKLLKSIIANNLQEKVKLLGHLSEQDKYDYLQASFLLCLPSVTKAEAFGVVLVEAMAFSKPIVTTNLLESGMSWVNKDAVSGLQVNPKSPKKLAEAFQKIANDKKFYELLCVNSFKRYQHLFTRDKMIASLKKLYQSIL
ncbi:MAG: glycosyltransferase, partial [Patescibacteria group bacterium]|nr:glycosyltransferase [Patescibacteria group bacterium]